MSHTNTYTVAGMTCSGCAANVSTAVQQVSGVLATDVDLATGTIRVTGGNVEDAAVRAAVTDAGYQVD